METHRPPRDYHEETALAERVARIFGYYGLKIEVSEGAGWATRQDEDVITLIVDPTMLQPQTLKDASGNQLPDEVKAPQQYAVYGIAHELGHVDDFMQPDNDPGKQKIMKPSEHFFWNVLDDSVINRRLRNIPLLDNLTDEIYREMLFPLNDYTKLPQHIQFMYGWLLRNVTPGREIRLSDKVAQALDRLENLEIQTQTYDLQKTLAHPDTNFAMRHEIARFHILPIYESFLEEDQEDRASADQTNQTSQQGTGSEQAGPGSGSKTDKAQHDSSTPADWDEIYNAYSDVSHCGHSGQHPEDQAAPGDPHQVIKNAADALQERQKQQAETAQPDSSDQAGSIAAELKLSLSDAKAYQDMAETYREQTQKVAQVLQQLAVPSVEYTRPRLKQHPDTVGSRLSPRELFRVVVAQHNHTDPAVWRPVETVSAREGVSFNGLDVHILIDASQSMRGQKAGAATACSIMLMEGLAAARRMVERHHPQASKPDVRLQVILFGSSAQVVAPLSHETKPVDKGIVFTTVREANSESTLVTDALRITTGSASAHPERTQLVYVITDGVFSDRGAATRLTENAGGNYFLYQYILLSPSVQPITPHASHLNNPNQLPNALNTQLKAMTDKFLFR